MYCRKFQSQHAGAASNWEDDESGFNFPQESLQADVEMNTPRARGGGRLEERDIANGQPLSALARLLDRGIGPARNPTGSNASQTTTCVSRRIT